MPRHAVSPAPRIAASGPVQGQAADEARGVWLRDFRRVRAETERRAAHLSAEDQIVQSMADASPTKWHRAPSTWFFEQRSCCAARPATAFSMSAFRSCSIPITSPPVRATRARQRGLITRPNGDEVAALSRPCRCRASSG